MWNIPTIFRLNNGVHGGYDVPMTREEAIAIGSRTYDSDKPCRHGHVGKRRTHNWSCLECHKKDTKARVTAEDRRWRKKKRKYGINKAEVLAMLESQNGQCPGCCADIRAAFDIEHCHDTGQIRGLMCHPCNKALAFARDRPDTLRRLADYLDRKGLGQ